MMLAMAEPRYAQKKAADGERKMLWDYLYVTAVLIRSHISLPVLHIVACLVIILFIQI